MYVTIYMYCVYICRVYICIYIYIYIYKNVVKNNHGQKRRSTSWQWASKTGWQDGTNRKNVVCVTRRFSFDFQRKKETSEGTVTDHDFINVIRFSPSNRGNPIGRQDSRFQWPSGWGQVSRFPKDHMGYYATFFFRFHENREEAGKVRARRRRDTRRSMEKQRAKESTDARK